MKRKDIIFNALIKLSYYFCIVLMIKSTLMFWIVFLDYVKSPIFSTFESISLIMLSVIIILQLFRIPDFKFGSDKK